MIEPSPELGSISIKLDKILLSLYDLLELNKKSLAVFLGAKAPLHLVRLSDSSKSFKNGTYLKNQIFVKWQY
jgi:hypothetical protein